MDRREETFLRFLDEIPISGCIVSFLTAVITRIVPYPEKGLATAIFPLFDMDAYGILPQNVEKISHERRFAYGSMP
jgi:hypothetical protein